MEISYEDVRQQYLNTVCLYKKTYVYVEQVTRDYDVKILAVSSGKSSVVKFDMEEFKPVNARLGFVNHKGCAFYVQRMPFRQFKTGLCHSNTKTSRLPVRLEFDDSTFLSEVAHLYIPALVSTFRGEFPSFVEAKAAAKQSRGTCAFDRQFAIDYKGTVYYRTEAIGGAPVDAKTVKDIVLQDNFKHLYLLMEPDYAKALYAARS